MSMPGVIWANAARVGLFRTKVASRRDAKAKVVATGRRPAPPTLELVDQLRPPAVVEQRPDSARLGRGPRRARRLSHRPALPANEYGVTPKILTAVPSGRRLREAVFIYYRR